MATHRARRQRTKRFGPNLHPLAKLFPPMSESELERLAASIKRDGLHHPIIRYQGKILDGRNRYHACREAGVRPRYEDLPDDADPLAFVLAENVERRQLSTGQRAITADKLASTTHGGDRRGRDQEPSLSLEDAARRLGISRSTVKMARELRKEAESGDGKARELLDRVGSGGLTLSNARTLLQSWDPVAADDDDDRLELKAADHRAAELRARRKRNSSWNSGGRRTREELVQDRLFKLVELAARDSPNLRRFRGALRRLRIDPTLMRIDDNLTTVFDALRVLDQMLERTGEQISRARRMAERFRKTGSLVDPD